MEGLGIQDDELRVFLDGPHSVHAAMYAVGLTFRATREDVTNNSLKDSAEGPVGSRTGRSRADDRGTPSHRGHRFRRDARRALRGFARRRGKARRHRPMPGGMVLKPPGRPGNASTQTRRSTYRFTTDHNEPPTAAGSRNTFNLKPRAAPSSS